MDPIALTDEQQAQVRRYGLWVTVGMMVLCNVIFLGGMWLTGVKLEQLIRIPDIFNPRQDVCLRFTWHQVEGTISRFGSVQNGLSLRPFRRDPHVSEETEVVKGGTGSCTSIMGRGLIIVSVFVGSSSPSLFSASG